MRVRFAGCHGAGQFRATAGLGAASLQGWKIDGQRCIFAAWALGGSLWESSSGDAKRAYRLNVLLRFAIGGQQRESPVRSWSGQTR